MRDYSLIEKLLGETIEDIQDRIELDFLSAYNIGYEAGFREKEYVEQGHCTGCVYEFLGSSKEPCSNCRNSHKNLYKEKRRA